jgi:uncharacterized membrane protein
MSKLSRRPEWPDGKEPINGGLWLVQAVLGVLVIVLLVLFIGWALGRIAGRW